MADFACIVAAALVEMAVEKHAGTDTAVAGKVEIDEAVETAGNAVKALADRRRRRIVFDEHRQAQTVFKLASHRKALPSRQILRAERGHPSVGIAPGKCHADPEKAAAVKRECSLKLGDDALKDRNCLLRIGMVDVVLDAGADGAGEIGQNAAGALTSKLKADRIGALRIDRVRNDRLSARCLLRLAGNQKVRARQFLDNVGHRLRGQRGHPRDRRPGQRSTAADRLDHNPAVMEFRLLKVGARYCFHGSFVANAALPFP